MKIKIVYLISSLRGCGPTNVLYNLVDNLDRGGCDIVIITLKEAVSNNLKNVFEKNGIKCLCLNISKIDTFVFGHRKLKKALLSLKPDVVHAHCWRSTWLLSKVDGAFVRIATLHCYPHIDYKYAHGSVLGRLMYFSHLCSLRRMDVVVACSNAISIEMKRKASLYCYTIQNGVSGKYDDCSKGIKDDLHDFSDQVVLLCIGAFNKRKNQIEVLTNFRPFLIDNRMKIIFLGDGKYRRECESYNIKNAVFMGNVDNVFMYLDKADGIVSASKAEGMPMAVLEALMRGVPKYILSDIAPHREIASMFRDNIKLVDFSNLSEQDLMDVYNFLSGENNRQEVIKEANKKVSAELMSQNYMKLYKKLLSI